MSDASGIYYDIIFQHADEGILILLVTACIIGFIVIIVVIVLYLIWKCVNNIT